MTEHSQYKYSRSRTHIEIDITYACNLRCESCDRSVTQAPSNTRMSLSQIERFLKESENLNYKWEEIRLLGGEPSLHPEFHQIIDLLFTYKRRLAPSVQITVCTNGNGDAVKASLERLPKEVVVVNTRKTGDPKWDSRNFGAFNIAPQDQAKHQNTDFRAGCCIPQVCGMGLNAHGFYPCGVAGGIDRIVGLDSGRKTLPAKDDEMRDQMAEFCRLCGLFDWTVVKDLKDKPLISKTWQRLYQAWRSNRPRLSRYGVLSPPNDRTRSGTSASCDELAG